MLNTVSPQKSTGIGASVTTSIYCDPNATRHQIKINKDGGTSGTLALTAKTRGADSAEVVYDQYGAAITFNLASSTAATYVIDGSFDEFIITPTTLNGTYKFHYCAW